MECVVAGGADVLAYRWILSTDCIAQPPKRIACNIAFVRERFNKLSFVVASVQVDK